MSGDAAPAVRKLRRQALMESVRSALAAPGAAEEYERWRAERRAACKQPAPGPGDTPATA